MNATRFYKLVKSRPTFFFFSLSYENLSFSLVFDIYDNVLASLTQFLLLCLLRLLQQNDLILQTSGAQNPLPHRPRHVVVPVLLSSPSCRRRYPLVVFVVGRRPHRRSCRRRLRCPLVVRFVKHPRATLRAGARSGAVGFAPSSFSLVLTPRLPCEQGLAAVGVSSCRHLVVTIELEPKKEEKK